MRRKQSFVLSFVYGSRLTNFVGSKQNFYSNCHFKIIVAAAACLLVPEKGLRFFFLCVGWIFFYCFRGEPSRGSIKIVYCQSGKMETKEKGKNN